MFKKLNLGKIPQSTLIIEVAFSESHHLMKGQTAGSAKTFFRHRDKSSRKRADTVQLGHLRRTQIMEKN